MTLIKVRKPIITERTPAVVRVQVASSLGCDSESRLTGTETITPDGVCVQFHFFPVLLLRTERIMRSKRRDDAGRYKAQVSGHMAQPA